MQILIIAKADTYRRKACSKQVIQSNPSESFMDEGKTADSRLSEIIYRSFLIHIDSITAFEYPFSNRRFCGVAV